jgi:hypothetical protein
MSRIYYKALINKRYGLVLYSNPNIQSPASLALLSKQLAKQSNNFYNPFKWIIFRRRFFKRLEKEGVALTCKYCHKDNLYHKMKGSDKRCLATLDHIVPVSKGGLIYDVNNLAVVCYPCNNRKKNLSEEEFCLNLDNAIATC